MRKSEDRRRRPGGFTLLEVMVALAVVAFAFVALLGLHGRNVALVTKVDDYSRAVLLARQMMSQIQFEDFYSLGDASGTIEWDPRFRWERTVETTSLETVELANVKRVRLRIVWDENIANACELIYWITEPSA